MTGVPDTAASLPSPTSGSLGGPAGHLLGLLRGHGEALGARLDGAIPAGRTLRLTGAAVVFILLRRPRIAPAGGAARCLPWSTRRSEKQRKSPALTNFWQFSLTKVDRPSGSVLEACGWWWPGGLAPARGALFGFHRSVE